MRMKRISCVVSIAVLCIFALAIAPFAAYGADKLIVKDGSSNTKFVVRDDGSIMLNTATWDAPAWAKFYTAVDNNISGLNFDSFSSSNVAGGGGLFRFARGTQASKVAVQTGDRLGYFSFGGYDGATFYNTAALTAKVDGAVSTGVVPTKITFETGTNYAGRTERMVISSVGNVGIGTTSPQYLLDVNGQIRVQTTVYSSSRTIKDNIVNLEASEASDALKELTPVRYNYKNDPSTPHIGFIAEDVPTLVAQKHRDAIDPMDVVAVLTKVVQQQDKTIETLSDKLAKLEAKLNRLESKDITAQK